MSPRTPEYRGEEIYLSERLENMVAAYMRQFARRAANGYAQWINGMDDHKIKAMILKERSEDITLDNIRRVRRKHVGKLAPGQHNLGKRYNVRPRMPPVAVEAPEPPPPTLLSPSGRTLHEARAVIWPPPPTHQHPGEAYTTLIGLYAGLERQLAALDAKVDRLLEIWR